MRISLSNLEFNIQGSGVNAVFQPLYLQTEESNKVQAFIQFLEENTNNKKSEIPFDLLSGLFPSEKISKSLAVSSNRFYSFSSQSVEDLLGIIKKEERTSIQSENIADFLSKSEKIQTQIINLTPQQIRSKVFDLVNKSSRGFVSLEKRGNLVSEIEEELNIPKGKLDELLYFDIDSEQILIKNEDADPIQLICYFNYDTIETILCFALNLQIVMKKLPGYLAKNLVFVSKKNSVFTDITLTEEGYKISIEPPIELFRDTISWGRNISNVATYILRTILREEIPFQLNATVRPRKRRASFTLSSEYLPLLPSFKKSEEEEFKPEIDSKVENKFLKTWRNYKGWKAKPEPEAIIAGKKMYVPDFLLQRGEKEVYLEIVGYYTMKYIQKKKMQMKELSRLGVPIIYLIDESIESNFSDVKGIVTTVFSGTDIPNNEVARLLEDKYTDYEERLPVLKEKVKDLCSEINDKLHLITIQRVQQKLETYTTEEASKALTEKDISNLLKENNILFLSSFGLVKEEVVKEVQAFMETIDSINLSKLKEEFPDYKEALIVICQHLGYNVNWKSINEIEIAVTK